MNIAAWPVQSPQRDPTARRPTHADGTMHTPPLSASPGRHRWQDVHDWIIRQIDGDIWSEGTRLPSVRALARALSSARWPRSNPKRVCTPYPAPASSCRPVPTRMMRQ